MTRAPGLRWCAFVGLALGCTETPFRFFTENPGGPACTAEGCAGTPAAESGGASAGFGGASAPVEPSESCESVLSPESLLVRLQLTESGSCVSVGVFTELASDPAYETRLAACAPSAAFWFSMRGDDSSRELRSEATNYNLDVRFAASQSGTALVLYAPHFLYNQRFRVLPAAGETFRLSPLHASTQCVSERAGRLEIWPCDDGDPSQTFRKLTCR